MVGILVLAGGAFYTALVVATQVDEIFFPGSQITLGGLPKLPGIDTTGGAGDLGGGRINVLVMGLDRRPSEGKAPARTDTMFVMSIDPLTKTARGLAMPRDLYVDIPTKSGGSFKERINTAYVYGETSNYPGGGTALAKATVEKLLNVKLHYYLMIDFEGFKELIELLGGIDVDVPAAVNDPFYSDTEALGDFYPCVFNVGVHHMDGKDALCYARTRRNSSDLDRIQRQQRIIFAALDKAASLTTFSDPRNLVELWKRYKDAVETDVPDLQIPGFARLAVGMDSDNLAFLTLAPAVTPFTTSEGASVLLPSPEGVKTIVNALFSDHRLEQEAAMVEVQNGTDKQGLAQRAMDFLISLGIPKDRLTVANAAESSHPKTEIIDFAGKRYTAERIAGWLDVPKNRVRAPTAADEAIRLATRADIVVILGADAKVDTSVVSSP